MSSSAQPPDLRLNNGGPITYGDVSEQQDPSVLPWLDRPDVDESALDDRQRAWRRDGYLILPRFLPDEVTDPYIAVREAKNDLAGWTSSVPYLHVPELRRVTLYPPLMNLMENLFGEPMLMHLNLTGWISSERDWHQDGYLNPPGVNDYYCAVWMALGDIHPDSGPFEFIPGSHRWPPLRGEKVRELMTAEERERREGKLDLNQWAKYTERFLTPVVADEIIERDAAPEAFLAKKGDVLIWHARLMHRGSLARRPLMERRSLIAHYSGTHHRPDMLIRLRDENGMEYAGFDVPLF